MVSDVSTVVCVSTRRHVTPYLGHVSVVPDGLDPPANKVSAGYPVAAPSPTDLLMSVQQGAKIKKKNALHSLRD